MPTAVFDVKIKSNGNVLLERDVTISDGSKESIKPAISGFAQQLYIDGGLLLTAPPIGPLDEVITVETEYQITVDGNTEYETNTEITAKRFLVLAGLEGMRVPQNNEVMEFIEEFFV